MGAKGTVTTLENPGDSKLMRWLAESLSYEGDECLLWPFSVGQNGYGGIGRDGKHQYIHRIVCEHVNGPPLAANYHAAHSCGQKRCVNKRHLSWKTNSENQLDRRQHGTTKKTHAKLTPENVAEIRSLEGIEPTASLAARFGVNEASIRQIFTRKIWRTGKLAFGGFWRQPTQRD